MARKIHSVMGFKVAIWFLWKLERLLVYCDELSFLFWATNQYKMLLSLLTSLLSVYVFTLQLFIKNTLSKKCYRNFLWWEKQCKEIECFLVCKNNPGELLDCRSGVAYLWTTRFDRLNIPNIPSEPSL